MNKKSVEKPVENAVDNYVEIHGVFRFELLCVDIGKVLKPLR